MIQDAYSSLYGSCLTHYQKRLGQDRARLVIFRTELCPQDHPKGTDSKIAAQGSGSLLLTVQQPTCYAKIPCKLHNGGTRLVLKDADSGTQNGFPRSYCRGIAPLHEFLEAR